MLKKFNEPEKDFFYFFRVTFADNVGIYAYLCYKKLKKIIVTMKNLLLCLTLLCCSWLCILDNSMAQDTKRVGVLPTSRIPAKAVIDQKQLRLNQPKEGRLDIDVATLKEGKNVVCKNTKTGSSLIAIVEKGKIVGWELEQAPTNKKGANARLVPSTIKFEKNHVRQYQVVTKNKQRTIVEVSVDSTKTPTLASSGKSAARGFTSTTSGLLPLGVNCTNITCDQCFMYASTCDRCKNCPTSGTKDPPIIVGEGSGVGIEEDEQYYITQWGDPSTSPIYTYNYSYTSYVTLQSSYLFTQMGW